MSNRLQLRRPMEDDFARYYAINSDPATNTFNPHGAMSYDDARIIFADILAHWQQEQFGIWTVTLPDQLHHAIGFGGISYRNYGSTRHLNLGYRFDPDYWGNGYASELANRAITFAFQEQQATAVYALVRPQHKASIRVLEKNGMTCCNTLDDVPPLEPSLVYYILKPTHDE
ncbi:GNAT family N-acetyltransferase [Cardiobacteriaceae bacterium TAE3-ERU3]|nr:GNAT family N-acetyltransferase [Cardiobacteriaceae bacterium TAE3-ERU3]